MRSVFKPDPTDLEIIALLNEDGRMPSAKISRRLGSVSARTVTNRIEVLTREGVINVRAVVNPDMVGFGVLADVFIETEPGQLREVAERVAEFSQVSYVACATGDTDVIISVRAQNIEELYDFVIEVLGKIPGVRQTQTILLPLKIKNVTTWIPPNILDEGEDSSD